MWGAPAEGAGVVLAAQPQPLPRGRGALRGGLCPAPRLHAPVGSTRLLAPGRPWDGSERHP
eukprot:10195175-Alexandrium_andersonii.AAC.1